MRNSPVGAIPGNINLLLFELDRLIDAFDFNFFMEVVFRKGNSTTFHDPPNPGKVSSFSVFVIGL